MWIGFVIVMLVSGGVVTDAATFDSRAECEAMNAEIAERIKASEQVASYRLECVSEASLKRK